MLKRIDIDALVKDKQPPRNAKFLPSLLMGIMIGGTGQGKTDLLLNLILQNKLEFDRLYLLSSTIDQPKYQYLRSLLAKAGKRIGAQVGFFYEDSKNFPKPHELDKSFRNLCIFDDLNFEEQRHIAEYYTKGRHSNVNCLLLSQSYTKIGKNLIRGNANYYVLFHGLTPIDQRTIHQQIVSGDMSLDEFKQFFRQAAPSRFQYAIINLSKAGRERYQTDFGIPWTH